MSPTDSTSSSTDLGPFALDQSDRHGEWEHRALMIAVEQHPWAAILLGM